MTKTFKIRMTFRSKYTWWIVAVMAFAILLTPALMVVWGFDWYLLISSVLIAAFFVDMMLDTSYTIIGDKLRLKAGCIFHTSLDIQEIKSIYHQKTCVNDNSFAWSTDRLTLLMPRGHKYQVSPIHEIEFIDALLKINPDIQVD